MDRNIIVRIVKEFPVDRRSLPNIAESCRIDPKSDIISRISIRDRSPILSEFSRSFPSFIV